MWQVGVRGFTGSMQAQSLDEVTAGLFCLWVTTPGGARIDASELSGVTFHIGNDEIARTTVTFSYDTANGKVELDAIGGLQIIYCDAEGNPLP